MNFETTPTHELGFSLYTVYFKNIYNLTMFIPHYKYNMH